MTEKEKKLLKICIKHIEQATSALPQIRSAARFSDDQVSLPQEAYFNLLAALDRINNVKEIIKERAIP